MEARSLRDDLLGIAGVEDAEVDGDDLSPAGLRIRIAEGADQQFVGQEIRRVLSAHGLGTDTVLPGEGVEPIQEPAMASVSELASEVGTGVSDAAPRRIIDLTESPDDDLLSDDAPLIDRPTEQLDDRPKASVTSIDHVSVDEGRAGITVTLETTDGRRQTEIARVTEGGVDRAVILGSTRLAAPDQPDPIIIDVDERRVEGVDIVMIVLDCNGRICAGSAVVGAGRAFALARAAWAAVAS